MSNKTQHPRYAAAHFVRDPPEAFPNTPIFEGWGVVDISKKEPRLAIELGSGVIGRTEKETRQLARQANRDFRAKSAAAQRAIDDAMSVIRGPKGPRSFVMTKREVR
jgi:hypothetical protein